jgi:hypothetical protein
MNTRLQRVLTEIEKTKGKIAAYQEKLKSLEQQKIELENAQIVALFRKEKLTGNDLAAFIQSKKPVAAVARKEESDVDN